MARTPTGGVTMFGTLIVALCVMLPKPARAQFDTTGWRFAGAPPKVEPYAGRESLALHDGLAYLRSAVFRNGTIEFDVNVPNAASFVGVQFRMQGASDYEDFYLRPMNSKAADATQYQPVFHGNTGWQIYVGPRYTAPLVFRHGEWMHLKLVIRDARAAVYLDSDSISQYIPALRGVDSAGFVSIYSNFAEAHFANFHVDTATPTLPMRADSVAPDPKGAVRDWLVSSVISERAVDGGDPSRLAERKLSWHRMSPSERGIVNLGTVGARSGDTNTVLARFDIEADQARTVVLRFGYSDRVHVYLNGRLLYSGDATYQSRDPRFLGTIGLFDKLYLPLERGRNTVTFAVSESFGGWGITAALNETVGVRAIPARL